MAGISGSQSVQGQMGQGQWFAPAWLPPGGHGNGLTAMAWAPIADLPARIVDSVLDLLRGARVPAYAARAPRPVRPLLPGAAEPGATQRLWVASAAFSRAEQVLTASLPAREEPPSGTSTNSTNSTKE